LAAVILGWNPTRRNSWNYRAVVEHVAESGRFVERWSVGGNRNIRTGTEAWLLLQGSSDAGAGLIGHGVVMSEAFLPIPPEDPGATDWCVSVAFDALLPVGEQIRPDVLSAAFPALAWRDAISGSVLAVPPAVESHLRRLWQDHGPAPMQPVQLVPGTCPPDAVSTIEVNRYEQDPDARRVCLAFHGTACSACSFSFEAGYGDIGTGFIDVHHVVPPAMLGGGYQLDPVADLVPLCPNCHAMVHRGVGAPRTVSELRRIISASGHMRGEVVSELALEAQKDARRILEGRPSLKDLS
jgi:5-methylcytosine-specific restriction enzyme A